MTTRTPPAELDPGKALEGLGQRRDIAWQTCPCELVTPLYGGGVRAGEVDSGLPVRPSAIRGQLRFWWRLLARHKYGLAPDVLRQREFALWGGVGKEAQASQVWVRVSGVSKPDIAPWAEYERNSRGDGWQSLPKPEPWANAPYALFPAQGKRPGGADSAAPARLAKPGLSWTLQVGLPVCGAEQVADEVREALRWWASFGGIGARVRRGLGAVQVHGLAVVSVEEAAEAGCRLVLGEAYPGAEKAWIAAVNKLKDFRQKPDFARNKGKERPGRSRWPEPDALRRALGRHAPEHAPVHVAGQAYPRAAFGLPIIFHFKDRGDPADTILQPVGADRLASPLLLRPYPRGGKWHAAALLLPHAHVWKMKLQTPGGVLAPEAWWRPALAAKVPPMAGRGDDALSAFLNYFASQANRSI